MAGLGPRDTQDGRILPQPILSGGRLGRPSTCRPPSTRGWRRSVAPRRHSNTSGVCKLYIYIYKYKLTKFTINAARVEPANRLRYQSSEVRDGLTINNKKYHWSKDQREYHWARGPASITPRGFNPYRRGWIQGGGKDGTGARTPG